MHCKDIDFEDLSKDITVLTYIRYLTVYDNFNSNFNFSQLRIKFSTTLHADFKQTFWIYHFTREIRPVNSEQQCVYIQVRTNDK